MTAASRPPISSGEHRLRSENLAFDIDVWYPPLAEHTFHTVFLPLTRLEAQAIVAYYNKVYRHVQDGSFTDTVVETLLALESRIDQALIEGSFVSADAQDGSKRSSGSFLRLCGRSPKDGEPTDPTIRAKIWESYCVALRTVLASSKENVSSQQRRRQQPQEQAAVDDDDEHGNARVAAMAHTESLLRVRSGSEAVSLLLTSERVFSDMLDWLNYGEPEQIVIRQFCGSFDLSTEFRCYIQKGGVLCGISQYDTYARHNFLLDPSQRAVVVQAVVQEWIKVKDCIQTMDDSYCVDFGVDMERKRALLIEISPYRCCTGPALFAWKGEAELVFPDRSDVQDDLVTSVIEHEQVAKDAVFRFRSQVIPRIGDLVEMNWDYRWSKERMDTPKPYRDIYSTAVPTRTSLMGLFSNWLFRQEVKQHVLFVYGTLKRNCHWHSKYMTGAQFLEEGATAKPQSLVIGECGVPYLIRTSTPDDQAKPVRGELWSVSSEMLRGIDEYEGIHKGHYSRHEIAVFISGRTTRIQKAFCYFYAAKPGASDIDASLLQADRIAEYTAEEQKERYKPIHHIQVKQLQYLGEEATT